MNSKMLLPCVMAVMLAPLLAGHGDSSCDCGGDEGFAFGPPTEAVCPSEGTTLTFENFGDPFFEQYCRRCHSETVAGDARQGAPSDHNFDNVIEVRGLKDHIDWTTGAGPGGTNELMPIGDPTPTLEEREQLSEWLACDAPE